ncbi:MAG: Hsp20/alpha crystallin family protein [Egibacteraceae bacterium]
MVVVDGTRGVEFAALQREAMSAQVPPLDAYRTDAGLSVRMELPGMAQQDVGVSVADGRLTISGERRVDDKVEKASWVRRERSVGRFERTFTLPRGTARTRSPRRSRTGCWRSRSRTRRSGSPARSRSAPPARRTATRARWMRS